MEPDERRADGQMEPSKGCRVMEMLNEGGETMGGQVGAGKEYWKHGLPENRRYNVHYNCGASHPCGMRICSSSLCLVTLWQWKGMRMECQCGNGKGN